MTTNETPPVIFALGTLTTPFSFVIVGLFLLTARMLNRSRLVTDGSKGMF